ncbi:hypothetical protein RI054_06g31810 [Pseudoscourfieldia marina]
MGDAPNELEVLEARREILQLEIALAHDRRRRAAFSGPVRDGIERAATAVQLALGATEFLDFNAPPWGIETLS